MPKLSKLFNLKVVMIERHEQEERERVGARGGGESWRAADRQERRQTRLD